MPAFVIDGARLNVETAGSGPALVLLHGFTGSARTWHGHLEVFAERYTTVAPDLLGHGASDAPPDPRRYAVAHAVEDTIGILDRLAIRRAALLGYSMGGRVALATAIAAPERVAALVLESASPGLRGHEARLARAARDAALAETIERDGLPAFVEEWERQAIFVTQEDLPGEVRAALRAQRLQNNPTGLANSLRGFGQGVMPPMHDFLPAITAPALIVAGALDPRYVEIGEAMRNAMPRARLVVVPRAGHAVHVEQPETFQHVVLEFLRETFTVLA
ncbi:MAG: 2-succinyl-6-hydroxy-2,4-cyclohexadiene-1-carboxylate synthase [Armatimonadota bacterium]|nr:2-succinyl-6-hydroxy-2,4-cyclohexadiene-1-carboxylate synthase [Armatimonadota bacterium]MDR7454434.1 2-succinyl-6-hydroxy-2,4-cyclohexadiene-1-carboxylate synthase [Armatimonadota bacterium]MDR7456037.1 2-succinyl-6-hydroxy-2,4-cyclohexadiene-1-carboxylate synthase [Armatimonadota bacterium]MDR7496738.1 2-succinyl-6-hydroxy-2,4-cyclohexadiene-1-carboxylate synthase [Armatimonadota bacterium]MDR7511649.1 2-succinyl-6-hydroxy-2,4-cyclohexadiene-1-carboxylate synthase [Armatimonadota bacterium